MEFLSIVGVAAITVICFLVGQAVKLMPLKDEFIPVICGAVGGALGVVALVTHMPEFPADDMISAIAVGIVSGLAATGAHQVYKQFTKNVK